MAWTAGLEYRHFWCERMIVDCHTHIWSDPTLLGSEVVEYLRLQSGRSDLQASPADHALAGRCVTQTLVLGYRSAAQNASVPNEFIAEYVGRNSDRVIGIAGIDPTEASALREASALLARGEFRGLVVSPSSQNFHPADSRAMALYELAQDRGAPVFFHHGIHLPASGRMEYARPYLLDEIAREFPRLTIVVSALGHPWVDECIILLGKHPRVYADISGLVRRPWQAYNALTLAHQFNVINKVLFGSDFPFFTAAEAIEAVYRLNEMTQGTNLPTVPREALRSIVERDALACLGIERAGPAAPAAEGRAE